jgi:hypothetical protein
MNHMNRIIIVVMCLFLTCGVQGQSKKERKKAKVKSTTEFQTVIDEGKSTTYKASYEEYDRNGKSITKVDYGIDGSMLLKVTCKYDSYGNKVEETEFSVAKKKTIIRTMKYNAFRDKTEEAEYNGSGTLLKKTAYTYNADADKTSEVVTDAAGNVIKKVVYTYNSKKLKTGKKTLSGKDILESEKKWEYEYF